MTNTHTTLERRALEVADQLNALDLTKLDRNRMRRVLDSLANDLREAVAS